MRPESTADGCRRCSQGDKDQRKTNHKRHAVPEGNPDNSLAAIPGQIIERKASDERKVPWNNREYARREERKCSCKQSRQQTDINAHRDRFLFCSYAQAAKTLQILAICDQNANTS